MKRRMFLQASAAIATAGRILGANDRVNVVVIGVGGRGRDHVTAYSKVSGARVMGVCDVNQAAVERAQALAKNLTQEDARGYNDMKKVFDDKDVDAVSFATPNHWHALGTIWACQAGKDVYVEKPAAHNVFEGHQMIAAARKYGRMVQVGSQNRSKPHVIKAIQMLHDGAIGKVYQAKGLCYKRRKSIGHKPDLAEVPAGIDWEKFLGPAPLRPFNELRFAYNWHWFWDTGNGDLGNQGIHQMDIARWGLNREVPQSVTSTGGKYLYQDDQETPNTQFVRLDFGDAELQFEVRGLITGGESTVKFAGGNYIGTIFNGSDGFMAINDGSLQVFMGEKHELFLDEKGDFSMDETARHMQNFIEGVKSRKKEELHAEIEKGVLSADLVHYGNASYRVKRGLSIDAAAHRFTNDAEANAYLTRRYRAPYVVPEKV